MGPGLSFDLRGISASARNRTIENLKTSYCLKSLATPNAAAPQPQHPEVATKPQTRNLKPQLSEALNSESLKCLDLQTLNSTPTRRSEVRIRSSAEISKAASTMRESHEPWWQGVWHRGQLRQGAMCYVYILQFYMI